MFQAINSLLGTQPLQLDSGTIASVTVRIPWPNPFSSTVGLSLSGLRLRLRLAERVDVSPDSIHIDELAESVASVAESFIHDELTAKEEAQLRQSIHQEQNFTDDIPGSMSSFLSRDEELTQKRVNDPEGISIFARLFESLLARFDFDAADSQVSLTHEGFTIAIIIDRIRYFTSSNLPHGDVSNSKNSSEGEKRSVEISGVRVTMNEQRNSLSRSTDVQTVVAEEEPTAAHESSDSELDDDTQVMMSQSLAFLPPRPSDEVAANMPPLTETDPASPESSLYQSALSVSLPTEAPGIGFTGSESPVETECFGKTILLISEPITFQLTTPPVLSDPSENPERSPSFTGKEDEKQVSPENMKLEVSLGTIASLLDASCIRGLLTIADALSSAMPRQSTNLKILKQPDVHEGSWLEKIDISAQLKGLVTLVLGEPLSDASDSSCLSQFYERPLAPVNYYGGYLRIHVDLVAVSFKNEVLSEFSSVSTPIFRSPPSSPPHSVSSALHKSMVTLTVADFSILVFHSFPLSDGASVEERSNPCSPFLITDRHLDQSYHILSPRSGRADRHAHPFSEDEKSASLPNIDVTEWYSEHARPRGTSLRPWRTRLPAGIHQRRASGSLGAGLVSNIGFSSSPTRTVRGPLTMEVPALRAKGNFALSVQLRLGTNFKPASVGVRTTALHVFMDLELGRSVSQFIESVLPESNTSTPQGPSSTRSPSGRESDSEDDLPFSHGVDEERRRLERLVLEDLDLNMDYLQTGDATPRRRSSPTRLEQPKASIKHVCEFQFFIDPYTASTGEV